MPADIDILIVFADVDNAPTSASEFAWVSQFKKFLEFMLAHVLEEKPHILVKGEYDTMTSPRLDNVALLIPVLSKEFLASPACRENVEMFYNAVNKNPNRIYKVIKSPLNVLEQPEFLMPLIGYNMYQLDADSGEVREYTNYFSNDAERQYWMELVDLSYDLASSLRTMKNGAGGAAVKNLFDRKHVYLAETSHDLSVERSIITRELQRYGYTVLPDRTLPFDAVEIEKVVRNDLDQCGMSIHLIGNSYGEIPDGSTRSIVDLQHKIASEKSQEAKTQNELFSRLIWISPHLLHTNERQKKFIETLKRDIEMQEGAEILETPLEHFKNVVREELLEAQERKAVKETGGKAIYLVHDKVDHETVKGYVEIIESCGFHVLMPAFDGQLVEQRQKHIENLRAFDAAIIYKGTVSEQWVRMKAMDLMKAPGFGRKKPIIAKAILTAPGDIVHRDSFKNQNFRLIEGDNQHFIESLKLFLLECST